MATLQSITVNDTGNFTLPVGTSANRSTINSTIVQWSNTGTQSVSVLSGSATTTTTSWTCPAGVSNIELLIVAGGGSGGCGGGNTTGVAGGGGAGGVIYYSAYPVIAGTGYSVTVGQGGTAVTSSTSTKGNTGQNSIFNGVTASGGGGGGINNQFGLSGGSGGGGGDNSGGGGTGGAGIAGQGYPGSTGSTDAVGGASTSYGAGGGGGAGGPSIAIAHGDLNTTTVTMPGISGVYAPTVIRGNVSGSGGPGVLYSITGTPTYYGGGGGGGGGASPTTFHGAGGIGGGGRGGDNMSGASLSATTTGTAGTAGTAGTGGGGGASGSNSGASISSGAGGSGTVVIRYSLTSASVQPTGQLRYNTSTGAHEAYGANNIWEAKKYNENFVTDGLVSWYDAGNVSGSTWTETVAANNGTLVNSPPVSTINGGSVLFDGGVNNHSVTIPSAAVPTGNTISIGIWNFGPDHQALVSGSVIEFRDSGGNRQMNIHLPWGDGNIYWDCPDRLYKRTTGHEVEGWHYWVFTKNANNGVMQIYHDGKLWAQNFYRTSTPVAPNGICKIGSYGLATPTNYHKGRIGSIGMYNKVLTDKEIMQNYMALAPRYGNISTAGSGAMIPQDQGNGRGWAVAQGADNANITGFTNDSMLKYSSRLYSNNSNGGAQSATNWDTGLSYASGCPGSSNFSFHTGHSPAQDYWPAWLAIKVSNEPFGKVLNQIDWQTHTNGVGNVDFYGSNRDITSQNFTDISQYTFLGRANFGGSGGGGSDCTVYNRSFNPFGFGYRWYMLVMVDNSGSGYLYPNPGATQGGWAMYRLRLNKVNA